MAGEGGPGFPTCLLLLRINKRLKKVYRDTPEYAYYLSPVDLPPFSFLWIMGLWYKKRNVHKDDFIWIRYPVWNFFKTVPFIRSSASIQVLLRKNRIPIFVIYVNPYARKKIYIYIHIL